MNSQIKNKYLSFSNKGFTLVELLVVLGIFSIMTTIVMVKSTQFNNIIVLKNLAYEVALSIREAQVFGLSVREAPGSSGDFSKAYGVRFVSLRPADYDFFVDLDGSRTVNTSSEILNVVTLQKGYTIQKICAVVAGLAECSDSSSLSRSSVAFLRPNPEGYINTNLGDASEMSIHLASPQGDTRTVTVRTTGQISVE